MADQQAVAGTALGRQPAQPWESTHRPTACWTSRPIAGPAGCPCGPDTGPRVLLPAHTRRETDRTGRADVKVRKRKKSITFALLTSRTFCAGTAMTVCNKRSIGKNEEQQKQDRARPRRHSQTASPHVVECEAFLLDQPPALDDAEVAWLLLSFCAAQRLQHALRTAPPLLSRPCCRQVPIVTLRHLSLPPGPNLRCGTAASPQRRPARVGRILGLLGKLPQTFGTPQARFR